MERLRNLFFSHALIFLIILGFIVSVWRIWEDKIYFTDELLIEDAAFAFSKGEWFINPTVNHNVDLVKPPLVYWTDSVPYFFSRATPFTRRISNVFFGLGTVLFVYLLAERFYQSKVAALASVLLFTNGLYLLFVKTANFDLPAAFFSCAALYFYNTEKKTGSFAKTPFFIALSVLARSFLGLVILVVVLFDNFLNSKRRIGESLKIIGLTLLFVLPWHVASFIVSPQSFVNDYLKFATYGHGLQGLAGEVPTTPFFYFKIFLLFPLGVFGVYYLVKNHKDKKLGFQLLAWLTISFLVLSVSKTRHEWYAVPLMVPLAISSSVQIQLALEKLKNKKINLVLFKVALLTAVLTYPVFFFFKLPDDLDIIKAARFMQGYSGLNGVLYEWRDSYLTQTRFFPGYNLQVLLPDELPEKIVNKKTLYLLVNKKYTDEFKYADSLKIYDQGDYNIYLLKDINSCSTLGFCIGPGGGN